MFIHSTKIGPCSTAQLPLQHSASLFNLASFNLASALFRAHGLSGLLLALSIGIALASLPQAADAQQPVYNCRPNASGDGWICESTDGTPLPNTADGANQYNSDNATFPEPLDDTESPGISADSQSVEEIDSPGAEDLTQAAEESQTTSEELGATEPEPFANRIQPIQAVESRFPLDWVPREAMTREQQEALAENCCGAFIDPLEEQPIPPGDPDSSETRFQAASGFRQISDSLIAIDGDVIVQQGSRTVENDQTTNIDNANNTVIMDGNVTFRELGLLLTGSSAFIDSDERINRVEAAQYVLHDFGAHGDANSIVYNSESGLVTIDNGEFSRCEPENEFWILSADNIVLDQANSRGYARNASIRLGNVPIFYYPFTLPFPLGDGRVSGLLPPSVGSTRTGGFDLEVPYYFNLAPHYDATISPRLVSDRGVMFGAEFRYLASWSMNSINFTHLASDDLFDPATKDVFGSNSPPEEDRWFVGLQHQGVIGSNFSTFIDYNEVSDEDYFFDFGGSGLGVVSQTHLNQQGRLHFNSDYLRAGVNVQRIQIIDPFINASDINKPFDRLPQFYFESGTDLPLGFNIGIEGEVTSFDRSLDGGLLSIEQLESGALVNGERINLEPSIGWSIEAPGWFVRTDASYKHISYSLQNQAIGTLEDPEIDVGVYSFDSGVIFERQSRSGSTQTLEPRIFYLYSEFQDQSALPLFDTSELNFSFNQLFRRDRFSGGDRVTDADQVSVALTSRFFDPEGNETARISLGQIRYFQDRQVTLANPLQNWQPRYSILSEQSAIAGEFALSLGDRWRLNTDVQWDEDRKEVIEGSFQIRYQQDNNRFFNISYRYRDLVNSPFFIFPAGIDPGIDQTDISGIWPITSNWKVLGRWNYDHSNSRNLESFAGVEWSNCCATIRLVGREWVDQAELFVPNTEPNRGVFVQITLNGLGDLTGGGLSNLLQDGIWGFRDTDQQ